MSSKAYLYAVTGDHSRLVYSRHRTLESARRARRALGLKWGTSHYGAEPRVVTIPADAPNAKHIAGFDQ